jgi:hypothetical protein
LLCICKKGALFDKHKDKNTSPVTIFFNADATLARSYIVYVFLFEACLMFQNNVLYSTLTTLIVIMEKYKQW